MPRFLVLMIGHGVIPDQPHTNADLNALKSTLAGAHMCLMTFHELCSKNLGAADYIALAGEFHSVALRGIPCFDASNKPEAYRFVTLIDVLYEHRIRVFCSAAGDPQELFSKVVTQQEAKSKKVRLSSPLLHSLGSKIKVFVEEFSALILKLQYFSIKILTCTLEGSQTSFAGRKRFLW